MKDFGTRPEKLAWVAVIIGVFLAICGVALVRAASCTSLVPASLAAVVLILLALVAVGRVRLARQELEEELAVEQYRRDNTRTELFEGADEAVKMAARANLHYVKYFVPAFTAVLGAAIIVTGYLLWARWNAALAFPVARQPLRYAALAVALFVGSIVAGSYFVGVSRENGCRWVRPCGAWFFLLAALFLTGGGVLISEHLRETAEHLDPRMARIALGAVIALGAEFLVNFVMEFYRPRNAQEAERPLYESRILALFTEPGGLARNVATSLDYQFGFKVSEIWFYRFLERTVMPFGAIMVLLLWLQTCFVVVRTEENGIRERFGRVVNVPPAEPLGPGLYFKLPAPFARIRKYAVERVQQIPIGYVPATATGAAAEPGTPDGEALQGDPTGRVIVWSRSHAKEETSFVVASEPDSASMQPKTPDATTRMPVTVYFMSASIPLYFKVNDLYQFAYAHADAVETLRQLATRETVRYMAGMDFFTLLTHGRAQGAAQLQQRIQAAANDIQLGIEIVFVGLQGLHPPVEVGRDFDAVVGSMEEKHEAMLRADQYAIQTEKAAEGEKWSLELGAEAYKQERRDVSEAEALRFRQQLLAYNASPELFVLNSFLDVFENEGSEIRKFVVTSEQGTEVFILDLQEKLRPDLLDLDLTEEQ